MIYEIISKRKSNREIKFKHPNDIFGFIKRYAKNRREQFIVITLDGSHKVIGVYIATIGIANQTIVHPREVFFNIIKDNAVAFVVAHNHPSGTLRPSPEDEKITERLNKAAKILGFTFLDHLVINKEGYYSFRGDGKLRDEVE